MQNIKELKSNLAKINFKVKVKTFGSLGKCLIFTDFQNKEIPTIFSPDQLLYWDPLIKFIQDNNTAISNIKKQIRY